MPKREDRRFRERDLCIVVLRIYYVLLFLREFKTPSIDLNAGTRQKFPWSGRHSRQKLRCRWRVGCNM